MFTHTNSCSLLLCVQSGLCKHLSSIAPPPPPSSPDPSNSACPLTSSWRKSNCDFLPKASKRVSVLTTSASGETDSASCLYIDKSVLSSQQILIRFIVHSLGRKTPYVCWWLLYVMETTWGYFKGLQSVKELKYMKETAKRIENEAQTFI